MAQLEADTGPGEGFHPINSQIIRDPCACTFTCVCMHICAICMYNSIHECLHVCINVSMCVCMQVYV